jgi:putative chitinase
VAASGGDERKDESMANISRADFRRAFPNCKQPDDWADALDKECGRVGVNTPRRVAHFLAQLSHESAGFTRFEENLNYKTPERLDAMFSRVKGTADAAALIARGPKAIGNRVYAERNGNGNEASGDGFRYRGMGPIQLTGRDNYAKASKRSGIDLVSDPEQILKPAIGAKVAADYWASCALNDECDSDQFSKICAAVNGAAMAGLKERTDEYKRLRTIWAG